MTYVNSEVLITGGLGFIGSHLARRLVELGANVTLVDSLDPKYGGNRFNVHDIESKVAITIGDVRDDAVMERLIAGKQYLFNLAGQTSHLDSMADPRTDLAINTTAQLGILEACRRVNTSVKLVYASTRQLYGRPDYSPVDERHPVRPVDVNGINKFAGESYHLLYHAVYGIRCCALRLTNTYGPGMRVKDARQTFLGIWIRQLLEGQTLKVYGDGTQLRDFNYVDDCVEAFLLAGIAEAANGKIYNIGSAEVVSLNELARTLTGMKEDGSFELVPFPTALRAIDIGDYYSDWSLIDRELGWSPKVSLAAGLEKTLAYYSDHLPHYVG